MPKDKTETLKRILPAAQKEFLEKGFEHASVRDIAAMAGITAAGLYRHFPDKEAMFAALVDPALDKLRKMYERCKASDYEYLQDNKIDEMWDAGAELSGLVNLIYQDFEAYKLILCCSAGTRYASFIHDFVMLEQQETMDFLRCAHKNREQPVKVNEKELHLLCTAYVNAVFEVVIHDFSHEEALHYLKTLQTFFYPGWRKILGL